MLISLRRNRGFLITGMMVTTTGTVALKVRTGGSKGAGILNRFEEVQQEYMNRGLEQGIQQGTEAIVKNMLKHGMSDDDIKMFVECEQEMIEKVRKSLE